MTGIQLYHGIVSIDRVYIEMPTTHLCVGVNSPYMFEGDHKRLTWAVAGDAWRIATGNTKYRFKMKIHVTKFHFLCQIVVTSCWIVIRYSYATNTGFN